MPRRSRSAAAALRPKLHRLRAASSLRSSPAWVCQRWSSVGSASTASRMTLEGRACPRPAGCNRPISAAATWPGRVRPCPRPARAAPGISAPRRLFLHRRRQVAEIGPADVHQRGCVGLVAEVARAAFGQLDLQFQDVRLNAGVAWQRHVARERAPSGTGTRAPSSGSGDSSRVTPFHPASAPARGNTHGLHRGGGFVHPGDALPGPATPLQDLARELIDVEGIRGVLRQEGERRLGHAAVPGSPSSARSSGAISTARAPSSASSPGRDASRRDNEHNRRLGGLAAGRSFADVAATVLRPFQGPSCVRSPARRPCSSSRDRGCVAASSTPPVSRSLSAAMARAGSYFRPSSSMSPVLIDTPMPMYGRYAALHDGLCPRIEPTR